MSTSTAGAGVGTGAGAALSDKPRLVLHFDANQTVVFTDAASGKDTEDIVQEMLAKVAWGRVNEGDEDGFGWEMETTDMATRPPAGLTGSVGSSVGDLCVYEEYTKLRYSRLPLAGLTGEALASRKAENKQRKNDRMDLLEEFVVPGGPGAKLLDVKSDIMAALSIPEDKKEVCKSTLASLAEGIRFLCPGYFQTLIELDAAGRDFRVVFRTFGSDCPEIIEEHNLFCSGKHPLYPGVVMDGTNGSVDRRLVVPRDSGRFVRTRDGGVLMASVAKNGLVDTTSGFKAVFQELNRKMMETNTLAFRDDYHAWNNHDRVSSMGKVMAFDATDPSVHHIFFDDNIREGDLYLVGPHDMATGRSLTYDESNMVYTVRALQVSNLLNKNFFLESIATCEANRAAQLAK